jgi:DNA-binding beta-propeller fold protein YncE
MTAPQQIALDEAHNAVYVVEYAASGNLYRIDLTSGVKTSIISTLNFPVGLVLSADLQYAYVSEQTTGPDKGRVSRFSLSGGARVPLVHRQLESNGRAALAPALPGYYPKQS